MKHGQRIGLVGCVKRKSRTAAPAKDLYVSALFRNRRTYVERTCDAWFILSAEHGLLSPSRVIEWYDRTLTKARVAERREWTDGVLRALDRAYPSLRGCTVEVHAGKDYFGFGLESGLCERGADVVVPTRGIVGTGRQVAFYNRVAADAR
jgi:hypothetical protein